MRLDKIKLSGFKSFVDPTTIHFPSNLVGVIGPNGCGKSNVIDAMRWVLGESSAKMLRGESMTDVIFSGSSQRQPVGVASVELIFDNSDGKVGGEYAGYTQISVRREVNREAQSTYFLNNTRCRRKDIMSAFYGTGLGARSYNVIEQGMISRFIEAKPEELRNYLEEVAGISKYKVRRRETENRIRHTRENMSRLEDVREELDKQLKSLQRQAQAAERYKELKEQERVLKAELCVLHWREIEAQLQEIEKDLSEQTNQREKKQAELQRLDTLLEEKRQISLDLTDEFNEVQQQYYSVGNEVTRLEQAIAHQKERRQQLLDDQAQLEQDFQGTQDHLAEDQDQIAELETEVQQLEPDVTQAKARYEQCQQRLQQAEQEMQTWQQQWDEFNRKAAAISQTAQVEKTKVTQLQQQLSQMHDRKTRLSGQMSQIDLAALADTIEGLQAGFESVEAAQSETKQQLEDLAETLKSQQALERSKAAELEVAHEKMQDLTTRYATLQALQQASLGQANETVGQWLEGQQLADKQRLLQSLNVTPGWEAAVETVLGGYLEAVYVDDIADVVSGLSSFAGGQLTLIEQQSVTSEMGRLTAKVEGAGAVAHLLNQVHVADDLAAALQLRGQLSPQESVVTKDGLWLGRHWLRVIKSTDEEGGMLDRENAINTLGAEIEEHKIFISELQQSLQDVREEITDLEARRAQSQQAVLEAGMAFADTQSQLQTKQKEQQQQTAQLSHFETEQDKLLENIETAEQSLSVAQTAYEEAIVVGEQDESTRQRLSSQREGLRNGLSEAQAAMTEAGEQVHSYEIRYQTSKGQLDTIRQNINRLEERLSSLHERREQLNLALEGQAHPDRDFDAELTAKLDQRLAVEAQMNDRRIKLDDVNAEIMQADDSKSTTEAGLTDLRDKLEAVRLESQGLKVRSQTLQEQLQEMEFELIAVNEALALDATVAAWQEEANRVENRISRLGAINLAAADEYESQSERKTYLDAQHEDLDKALTILENAMSKIDKETRTRFKETYETVNRNFKELFPKVFGGGSAYLELSGDDLLSTGVTVFAQPPGKKNSTIHLLSGGEKALCAVALVFSIFHLNPAPFCLLDEVDAPLDDANLLRYCSLVKEMSDKIQFIYITHNKIAMEMADQLLGVTMHEPGVSRLVTVDVEQAVEMAE